MNIFDQAVNQLKQRQQLLALLLFGLVAVMVWIVVDLISTQTSTAISADLKAKALTLTPTINSQVLQEIDQQTYYANEELTSFPIFKVIDANVKKTATSSTPLSSPLPATPPPTQPIDASESGSL